MNRWMGAVYRRLGFLSVCPPQEARQALFAVFTERGAKSHMLPPQERFLTLTHSHAHTDMFFSRLD